MKASHIRKKTQQALHFEIYITKVFVKYLKKMGNTVDNGGVISYNILLYSLNYEWFSISEEV